MSGQDEEVAVDGGREGARCFVIVHNISKRHNIGTLARSATAFGVEEVPCSPPRLVMSRIENSELKPVVGALTRCESTQCPL